MRGKVIGNHLSHPSLGTRHIFTPLVLWDELALGNREGFGKLVSRISAGVWICLETARASTSGE